MNTTTPLQALWDRLSTHDWYYQRSDDSQVYAEGEANRRHLRSLASTIEGGPMLFAAFQDWAFSGPAFNSPQQDKPQRPN